MKGFRTVRSRPLGGDPGSARSRGRLLGQDVVADERPAAVSEQTLHRWADDGGVVADFSVDAAFAKKGA